MLSCFNLKHLTAYLITLLSFSYQLCHSQDTTSVFKKTLHSIDSLVTGSLNSEGGIIPAPVFNPALGTGIAVLPVYVYQLKGVAPETNPSTSQGILYLNFTGSYLAGLKQTLYFNRNKYWLDAYAGYVSMNYNHYVQNGNIKESIWFKGFVSNVSFAFKIKDHWFLGPMFTNNYIFEKLTDRTDKTFNDIGYNWFHTPGVKLTHDSRDNIFYPETGWFSSLSYETLIHLDETEFNFDKFIFGLSNYSSIHSTKDVVLASRIFTQLGFGDLPLHEMASPGSTQILRGYITGNYLNSSIFSLQTELRWMFPNRWGFVGFVGYGWLFDEPRQFNSSISLPSIGAGVRYRIFPVFKINLGLDAAFGRDGSANVYFKLTESF